MPRRKPEPAIHTPAIHPFDQLHGTDTSGLIPGKIIAQGTQAKVAELTAYYGVAPSILVGLLDHWLQHTHPQAPIEKTVFLDVGAGKGRACLLASEHPFLRVEGVELNAPLAAIAKANIALWAQDPAANALSPIELHHADATLHPIPAEPTLAFLFHPFELPILRRFLRHIEHSRTTPPRPLRPHLRQRRARLPPRPPRRLHPPLDRPRPHDPRRPRRRPRRHRRAKGVRLHRRRTLCHLPLHRPWGLKFHRTGTVAPTGPYYSLPPQTPLKSHLSSNR